MKPGRILLLLRPSLSGDTGVSEVGIMNPELMRENLWNTGACQSFTYRGKDCILCPRRGHYELRYGEKRLQAEKTEDVFSIKFFDGKSLKEIAGDILDYEVG